MTTSSDLVLQIKEERIKMKWTSRNTSFKRWASENVRDVITDEGKKKL